EPDRDRDDADQEGKAGAVEDPGVDVTPELIDAEPVSVRRAGAAAACDQYEVLVLRPSVGEQRREDRHCEEGEDEGAAENPRRVPDQAPAGGVPTPAGSLVEPAL